MFYFSLSDCYFFHCSACAFDMCLLNYLLTYLLTYLLNRGRTTANLKAAGKQPDTKDLLTSRATKGDSSLRMSFTSHVGAVYNVYITDVYFQELHKFKFYLLTLLTQTHIGYVCSSVSTDDKTLLIIKKYQRSAKQIIVSRVYDCNKPALQRYNCSTIPAPMTPGSASR